MSAEYDWESDFFEGIEPFTADDLAGFDQVAIEWLADSIMRVHSNSLNEELTVSLECAKIMGIVCRRPDSPLI